MSICWHAGYYSRYAALRSLLLQFLAAGAAEGHPAAQHKQVLSLGAGYDTTFFQLAKEGLGPAKYIEIDFEEVCRGWRPHRPRADSNGSTGRSCGGSSASASGSGRPA